MPLRLGRADTLKASCTRFLTIRVALGLSAREIWNSVRVQERKHLRNLNSGNNISSSNYLTNLQVDRWEESRAGLPQPEQLIILPPHLLGALPCVVWPLPAIIITVREQVEAPEIIWSHSSTHRQNSWHETLSCNLKWKKQEEEIYSSMFNSGSELYNLFLIISYFWPGTVVWLSLWPAPLWGSGLYA